MESIPLKALPSREKGWKGSAEAASSWRKIACATRCERTADGFMAR